MAIQIASVPFQTTMSGSNDAEVLVKERFDLAQDYADQAIAAAEGYLASLSALFADAKMPSSEISYAFQNVTLSSELKRPSEPSDTIPIVDAPIAGTLHNIVVPTITIPTYTLESITNELSFQEPIYSSDLQDALKAALKAFVETGGTGLGSDIEDALWARARARQDILNERTYNEAEEYYASRGYVIPPGALIGSLTEALAEQTRADAQLNYEISIEQAKLARAQSEYSLNAALALEGQDKEKFTVMANRTLEAAKAAADVITAVFELKVREFIAKYEVVKVEVETEKLKADIAIAANENITKVYLGDVEAYKVRVQNEIAVVELIAKVYGYTVTGYEADAKVAAADLDAQIKVYQGNIDQANNQTVLSLKEAEMTIQSYLGALQLTSDSIKASGNISAQIAASALSAVNASASLGDSYARSFGSSSSYSASLNNSANLNETHSYDET